MHPKTRAGVAALLACAILPACGCSIRRFAVTKLGDALAESGTTWASDDDPELIRDALPFSLKLVESLLAETPEHVGLLTAAASGFTQYAWAYVQQDADLLEDRDLAGASALRTRARRLHLRALGYGLRGLEARHPGFAETLRRDPVAAAAAAEAADIPLLYWTAAAQGLAISLGKDDPDLLADLPVAEALIRRALALDETWEAGTLHEFMITFEGSRPDAMGGSVERARRHFERAAELAEGRRVSGYLAYAEAVSVRNQDRREFVELLGKALEVDPDAKPEWRLANRIGQQRARWLLGRVDLLFAE